MTRQEKGSPRDLAQHVIFDISFWDQRTSRTTSAAKRTPQVAAVQDSLPKSHLIVFKPAAARAQAGLLSCDENAVPSHPLMRKQYAPDDNTGHRDLAQGY